MPVYHETEFPASTFGWSPLTAVTAGRWRFVLGPKPALYDLARRPRRAREPPARARPRGCGTCATSWRRLAARRTRLAPPAPAPEGRRAAAAAREPRATSRGRARSAARSTPPRVSCCSPISPPPSTAWPAVTPPERGRSCPPRRPKSRGACRSSASWRPGRRGAGQRRCGARRPARRRGGESAERIPADQPRRARAARRPSGRGGAALRRALAIEPRSLPAALALGQLLVRSGRAAKRRRWCARSSRPARRAESC